MMSPMTAPSAQRVIERAVLTWDAGARIPSAIESFKLRPPTFHVDIHGERTDCDRRQLGTPSGTATRKSVCDAVLDCLLRAVAAQPDAIRQVRGADRRI